MCLLTVVTADLSTYTECMVCSSLSLFTLRVTHAQCNQSSWIYAEIVYLLSVVLLTFTSLVTCSSRTSDSDSVDNLIYVAILEVI